MTCAVFWERRAQQDREDIWLYLYKEAGLRVADATDKRFYEAVDLLKANPHMGVETDRPYGRRLALARLPFVIVYATKPGEVHILRLLHTSRKPA
ncbi:type II toxin-antitoxin system RelE/ParE family toxin [Leminorella grimontii]|uniref:type II toxin-antitoxin system RelE/ParE family toxin n=1 Tax=Leminorella grimontii TaxID=82981 RepID=UPI0021C48B57|nr:type II toxin-antitoxin system RelE/ParE family toxin [Leminorella grimontii]